MKRRIDGVTYNTQSAVKIATSIDDEMTLYQNCAGVFFVVGEIDKPYRDEGGKWQTRTSQKWKVVGDAAKARAWCERYGLVIVRDIADDLEMPPEPADRAKGARSGEGGQGRVRRARGTCGDCVEDKIEGLAIGKQAGETTTLTQPRAREI